MTAFMSFGFGLSRDVNKNFQRSQQATATFRPSSRSTENAPLHHGDAKFVIKRITFDRF